MKKSDPTKGEAIPVPMWAKVSALIVLGVILVLGIMLPVRVVPHALALLSNTISSVFIPDAETPATTTPVEKKITDINTSTTTAKVTKPKVSTPYGLADLEVRIVAVGYLTTNNVFIPTNTINSNQHIAVKFQIINIGTNNSGLWGFSAELPSTTDPRYNSPLQQNLRPGDRIEYTLGFYNPITGQNHIGFITANPSNTIAEYSKTNNVANVVFPISNSVSY